MKRKIMLAIALALIIVLSLAACKSANMDFSLEDSGSYNSEAIEGDTTGAVAERKIIYSANTTLYADNIADTIDLIKSSLNADEWMDYESVSSSYARFDARVKSDRIDEYITAISEGSRVASYSKTATDISLNYANKEALIASLEAERTRLNELYSTAAINEMIQINTRLSQIDLEISRLQGELNSYDSLIEYSKVTVYLYQKGTIAASLPFGERLNTIFINAWKALGAFFAAIIIALTAIFPFVVVLGPIAVGIFFLVRFIKARRNKKISAANNAAVKAANSGNDTQNK